MLGTGVIPDGWRGCASWQLANTGGKVFATAPACRLVTALKLPITATRTWKSRTTQKLCDISPNFVIALTGCREIRSNGFSHTQFAAHRGAFDPVAQTGAGSTHGFDTIHRHRLARHAAWDALLDVFDHGRSSRRP
jgi:hypothetical protein